MKKFHNARGFTLIEVLIALAILSIALTTIIKATAQNIKDTNYLQDKIIANWVAAQIINEARLGLLKLPAQQQNVEKDTEMLNRKWSWEAYTQDTPNSSIKEIHVYVYRKTDHVKLADIMSYTYEP